jgi:DNA-3-methyladenine glycosylase II
VSPTADVVSAERHLAKLDPVLKRLILAAGPCTIGGPSRNGTAFAELVRSITFQQLAGRAAATIHGRLVAAVGGKVTPATILSTPVDAMRAAGMSGAKTASVIDLATAFTDGRVKARRLSTLPDDEIVAELSSVRGIGRWTAEMFLMFHLGRLDVWPTGDLGVRNGYARAWDLPAPPKPKELESMGDRFRPYRSIVAWYCWRAMDTVTPET